MKTKLTPEQKEANKQARRKAKEEAKEIKRIENEKNQKEVSKISISIEWKKSRMWGYNPTAEAVIFHKDNTRSYITAKCSGCGYDKESTVIADIFNASLKYKLHQPLKTEKPYGIYLDNHVHYSGGIGTDCYYKISEAIGGKFKKVASGKTFDVYDYTEE